MLVLLVSEFVVDKTSSEVVSSSIDYIFSNKTKTVKRINKKVEYYYIIIHLNVIILIIYFHYKKMPKWDGNTLLHEYLKGIL